MRSVFTADKQLNIQAGEVCIAVRCADTYTLGRLNSVYSEFLCDGSPDIFVEIDIKENVSPEDMKQREGNCVLNHDNGSFYFSDKLVSGEYDFYSRKVRICIEKQVLLLNQERYYLNQLMCLIYNSCHYICGANRPNAHIIHSSAIIRDGHGFLFTGPSGIGKTTVAEMCRNYKNNTVINDEGNLVSRPSLTGTPITVQGIPIIGKLTEKNNLVAPLLCILLLKQGNKTTLSFLDRTKAFKRLMFQVVANVYFGQNDIKAILASKADACEEITKHVPCYELEFTLDSGLLHATLDSLQQSLMSGSKVSC